MENHNFKNNSDQKEEVSSDLLSPIFGREQAPIINTGRSILNHSSLAGIDSEQKAISGEQLSALNTPTVEKKVKAAWESAPSPYFDIRKPRPVVDSVPEIDEEFKQDVSEMIEVTITENETDEPVINAQVSATFHYQPTSNDNVNPIYPPQEFLPSTEKRQVTAQPHGSFADRIASQDKQIDALRSSSEVLGDYVNNEMLARKEKFLQARTNQTTSNKETTQLLPQYDNQVLNNPGLTVAVTKESEQPQVVKPTSGIEEWAIPYFESKQRSLEISNQIRDQAVKQYKKIKSAKR